MSDLKEEVELFLQRNFPQIQMHGGDSSVTIIDEDKGVVNIALGGACGGCGISPMTTEAIRRRLPQQVDGVYEVQVAVGEWGDMGSTSPRETPDAPF